MPLAVGFVPVCVVPVGALAVGVCVPLAVFFLVDSDSESVLLQDIRHRTLTKLSNKIKVFIISLL